MGEKQVDVGATPRGLVVKSDRPTFTISFPVLEAVVGESQDLGPETVAVVQALREWFAEVANPVAPVTPATPETEVN